MPQLHGTLVAMVRAGIELALTPDPLACTMPKLLGALVAWAWLGIALALVHCFT